MADELFRGYERVGFKTQKGILPDVEVYERGNSFFRVVSSIHGEKKWKPIHGAFTWSRDDGRQMRGQALADPTPAAKRPRLPDVLPLSSEAVADDVAPGASLAAGAGGEVGRSVASDEVARELRARGWEADFGANHLAKIGVVSEAISRRQILQVQARLESQDEDPVDALIRCADAAKWLRGLRDRLVRSMETSPKFSPDILLARRDDGARAVVQAHLSDLKEHYESHGARQEGRPDFACWPFSIDAPDRAFVEVAYAPLEAGGLALASDDRHRLVGRVADLFAAAIESDKGRFHAALLLVFVHRDATASQMRRLYDTAVRRVAAQAEAAARATWPNNRSVSVAASVVRLGASGEADIDAIPPPAPPPPLAPLAPPPWPQPESADL